MKAFFLIIFSSISFGLFCQAPEGIRLVDYGGSLYPIYGLAINKQGNNLLVSAYGGRFYMLEIGKEVPRSAFSQKEKTLWSKFLNSDFKWGAKPKFSPGGGSVLLKPLYENPNLVKIKPTSLIVLNTETGEVLLERQNVFSADYLDEDTVIISTESGLEWIDIKSGKILKKIAMPEVEALEVNDSGNFIALSFVPTTEQFAALQSINFRKRELKVATRGKRLLAVYQISDMKPVSIVDDEIDVVFRIKFSHDGKSLVLFTRNFKSRSGTRKADLRQENASKLLALNLIKVDIGTGEIDRDFYYSSYYMHMDYNLSDDNALFAYSSTGMVSGSAYKTINGLEIYDYNRPDKLLYSIKTRFRWFKKLPNPYQFTFIPNQNKCYISSGSDLAEWDYKKLPDHVFNAEGNDNEEVSLRATNQLDSLTNTPDFRDFLTKWSINGVYVFDITVFKKGTVSTIFSPIDTGTDIKAHNALLDYIRIIKFDDLEIPKDKRIKFRYTFNFENLTSTQ